MGGFPTLARLSLQGYLAINSSSYPVIASIAGSDSSAGAGLQADLKTATALGAWCHTVVTAVTAQTPLGVSSVHSLPVAEVMQQLKALFSLGPGFAPQVLKTGMLGSVDLVPELAAWLGDNNTPLVLDTVLVATSGARLAEANMPQILCEYLLPRATVITPNLTEAAALLNCEPARNINDMQRQLEALLRLGAPAVLLKGGHLPGDTVVDLLATPEGVSEFTSSRINTTHTHGSGCSLASAIAVGLAQGLALNAAVKQAVVFVRTCIERASHCHFVETNGPLVHFNLQEKRELS